LHKYSVAASTNWWKDSLQQQHHLLAHFQTGVAVIGMVFASAVGTKAAAAETGFELAAGMEILGKGQVMVYLTSRVPEVEQVVEATECPEEVQLRWKTDLWGIVRKQVAESAERAAGARKKAAEEAMSRMAKWVENHSAGHELEPAVELPYAQTDWLYLCLQWMEVRFAAYRRRCQILMHLVLGKRRNPN
jgi:hypothetical protein